MKALAIRLLLLWLSGMMVRATILAVPPVLVAIRADLGLSGVEVGFLTSLPVLLFATASLSGALLIARLGPRATLVSGLIVVAIGTALRGFSTSAPILYASTAVMGLGVAVLQPTMAMLVRQWTPDRVAVAGAVYANGILVGEIVPVWLAQAVLMPLLDHDWRLQLAVWAVPAMAVALLALAFAPPDPARHASSQAARWLPDFGAPMVWRLAFLFGAVNALYFLMNNFLPQHLHDTGHGRLIAASLFALNAAQLPASLVILRYARRLERRFAPYAACGLLFLASVGGVILLPSQAVVWATAFGIAMGAAFSLALTLPSLLCEAHDVPSVSAGIFTVSYTFAVLAALAGGLMWDVTGMPLAALAPLIPCALLLMAVARRLRHSGQLV